MDWLNGAGTEGEADSGAAAAAGQAGEAEQPAGSQEHSPEGSS